MERKGSQIEEKRRTPREKAHFLILFTKLTKLKFKGFCLSPRYVDGHPDIWDHTRNLHVPWGEIDFGNLIFTLPTETLWQTWDLGKIKQYYQKAIEGVRAFLSPQTKPPYRIVFDVAVPKKGQRCTYPSVLVVDAINDALINIDLPNLTAFRAISTIALATIRPLCFDVMMEAALAMIASVVAFRRLFPLFDPFRCEGLVLPPLFRELWQVHMTLNATVIPRCLAKLQTPNDALDDVPEDSWVTFVHQISILSGRNLTPFFRKVRPVPMNLQTVVDRLPLFP
jgi:hypothetical protein